jgi:hypothetical protein
MLEISVTKREVYPRSNFFLIRLFPKFIKVELDIFEGETCIVYIVPVSIQSCVQLELLSLKF